jgi:hypothetical protein
VEKMRIAIIVIQYLPKSTTVAAKMMHELALEFIEMGHEVSVITPDPTLETSTMSTDLDGVKVYYYKSGQLRKINFAKRSNT